MSQPHGKVLIVDDDSAIRRALRNTLHGMGFEVDDAAYRRSCTGSCA